MLTGEVKVVGPLDRETTPLYTLEISASDSTYTSRVTLTVTITDVNDEAPVFAQLSYSLSVSEGASPNDPIGTVTAVDGDLGVGGEVTYRILTTWGSDLFSMNPQSGLITLEGAVDYEDVSVFTGLGEFSCCHRMLDTIVLCDVIVC